MMTNFLAYKIAFFQLMLTEASDISKKMDLPTPHPIRREDAKCWMRDPADSGLGGTIMLTNFFFSFPPVDKLYAKTAKFYRLSRQKNGQGSVSVYDYADLAGQRSLIDPSGAYHLATNWLPAVSIDVAELEKKFGKPKIYRPAFRYPGAATNSSLPKEACGSYPGEISLQEQVNNQFKKEELEKLLKFYGTPFPSSNDWARLPIFHLEWGKNEEDFKNRKFGIPVEMEILGTTKELLELKVNWPDLVKKSLVLTNAAELLKIPDPPKTMQLHSPAGTNSPAHRK